MQTNTVAGRWGAVVLFLTLAVTLGFLVLASASPVEAAKGGQGKSQGGGHGQGQTTDTGGGGGGGGTKISPALSIADAGAGTVVASGSGYRANTSVTVYITNSMPRIVVADGAGSFQLLHVLEGDGPWTFTTWQYYGSGWHHMASATFSG